MTRAAVRARGPLTRVPVVRSCCANISVHCVQVSPYAFCMFAHEVLMPFEVKLKCSIPRDFLPPHRINIGSLSCRADAEGSMNMNPHAISSIVPRRRGYNIYRRSEGTIVDTRYCTLYYRGTARTIYRARPTIVRTGLRNRGISRTPPVVIAQTNDW